MPDTMTAEDAFHAALDADPSPTPRQETTMTKRQRTGYYSPPSDSWHRTLQAAYRAARKALAGTGQAASITYTARDGMTVIASSVSDRGPARA